jgi:hypothetical protein
VRLFDYRTAHLLFLKYPLLFAKTSPKSHKTTPFLANQFGLPAAAAAAP